MLSPYVYDGIQAVSLSALGIDIKNVYLIMLAIPGATTGKLLMLLIMLSFSSTAGVAKVSTKMGYFGQRARPGHFGGSFTFTSGTQGSFLTSASPGYSDGLRKSVSSGIDSKFEQTCFFGGISSGMWTTLAAGRPYTPTVQHAYLGSSEFLMWRVALSTRQVLPGLHAPLFISGKEWSVGGQDGSLSSRTVTLV